METIRVQERVEEIREQEGVQYSGELPVRNSEKKLFLIVLLAACGVFVC